MLPSRVAGGVPQSSSNSGISFQGDGHSQVAGNSNFGNSISTVPGHEPGSIHRNTVLNSISSSGPSVGASSLVTDANSGFSGSSHLQRSASFNNTEAYIRVPASPLSFSSNNIGMLCSSVMDVSSVMPQSSYQESGSQQAHQSQQLLGTSSASTPLLHTGQVRNLTNPYFHETTGLSQLQKKPRLDVKPEDLFQQQMSSRQIPNLPLQKFIQQQQILQTMTPLERAQLQQQQLLRQQFQLQGMPRPSIKCPYDGGAGVCSRRLMQYLYHERQRPVENCIAYWKKFVAEYYHPRAKKRWCLSLYNSIGHHSLGAFPQASMDSWQCDICGSKSGRGFEATYEVLPRLNEIKFASGIIDELLFLDLPRESRSPSGMMMLEFEKAVQESIYEQLRVVREGRLRIIFTPELKIASWEFCVRSHEELLSCRLVAPQVNQLLQIAQKCQNSISESGVDGVPPQDLQANGALVISAGRQLAKSLELQSLNDLGFSKRYVRCLQIADVVNSMKSLMDFCKDQKKGPIDGLKHFPRYAIGVLPTFDTNPNRQQAGGGGGPRVVPNASPHQYPNAAPSRQNAAPPFAVNRSPSSAGSSSILNFVPGCYAPNLSQLQQQQQQQQMMQHSDTGKKSAVRNSSNGAFCDGGDEPSSRSNSCCRGSESAADSGRGGGFPGEKTRDEDDIGGESSLGELVSDMYDENGGLFFNGEMVDDHNGIGFGWNS